jgi:hypothetical protein
MGLAVAYINSNYITLYVADKGTDAPSKGTHRENEKIKPT